MISNNLKMFANNIPIIITSQLLWINLPRQMLKLLIHLKKKQNQIFHNTGT